MKSLRSLVLALDYDGLNRLLSGDPALANAGIPLSEENPVVAHPLHRICDGVFNGVYTDDQAVEIARIFLAHGSTIDGFERVHKNDTPLIAAASLHAENVGLLYIDHGATVHHAGCHGGTALHWAAWTGRDKLVDRLISAGADIHRECIDFKGTPLLWAVHGYKFGGARNHHEQINCVRLLLEAGAEKDVFNIEGTPVRDFLGKEDLELQEMLAK